MSDLRHPLGTFEIVDHSQRGDPNLWRVGTKVPINVYEGNRPVCQCHTALDARLIVEAVNKLRKERREGKR